MGRWTLLVMTGIAAVTVVTGCRSRAAVDARRVARYERNLQRLAARDSQCHPTQVQTVRVAEDIWMANTCTGPREYILACRAGRRRYRGCNWQRVPTASEGAAQYLGCPPQMIQQGVGPNPMVRNALGCGRQITLALQCNRAACGWVPMSPAAGGGAPTAGGPPPGGPQSAPAVPPGYGAQAQGSVVVVPAN